MPGKLALIVPCYNEEKRLPLDQYARFLEAYPESRLCFVDDGSHDGTRRVLEAFCARFPSRAETLALPRNAGKAGAVRAGMLRTLEAAPEVAWLGFWDADLATPLAESQRFLDVLKKYGRIRCVVGSRWPHLGARIERTVTRHVIGRCVSFVIRRYLRFPIFDTQCGAKIFHRDEAAHCFAEPFISRWLFDVELFKRMILHHSREYPAEHIYEMPLVEWRDVAGSKLKFYHGVKIFWDLLRIALFYRRPSSRKTFRKKNAGAA